ncbi:MAG TPA: hypothetical protein PLZ51_18890, partial [Aggregatilineales bacterium]|nr:hypothetical protein [Aggregatilineales bacterium]
MFQEDFEDRVANGIIAEEGLWSVVQDGDNWVYQAKSNSWRNIASIPSSIWSNYILEIKFKWTDIIRGSEERIEIGIHSQENRIDNGYSISIFSPLEPGNVGI